MYSGGTPLDVVSMLATAWTESEIIWLFLGSGIVALLVRFPPRWGAATTSALLPMIGGANLALGVTVAPAMTSWPLLGRLAMYFAEAGALVFGSVLFLHYWGIGKASDLAGAIVAALKETKHDNAP